MQRRHQERGRHALARDVADQQRRARSPRQLEEVVVVAADLPGRPVPAAELEAGEPRSARRQDLALDLGGELHLALEPLLLQRLAVEARVLERDRRLVGEQGERARDRRRGTDPTPRRLSLSPTTQQARGLAVDLDGTAKDVARARAGCPERVAAVGEQRGELVVAAANGRARVAADGAAQPERLVLEQVERAAPRVEQRDGAQQDALRELLQVEGGGDREPDLVERLELDLAVALAGTAGRASGRAACGSRSAWVSRSSCAAPAPAARARGGRAARALGSCKPRQAVARRVAALSSSGSAHVAASSRRGGERVPSPGRGRATSTPRPLAPQRRGTVRPGSSPGRRRIPARISCQSTGTRVVDGHGQDSTRRRALERGRTVSSGIDGGVLREAHDVEGLLDGRRQVAEPEPALDRRASSR